MIFKNNSLDIKSIHHADISIYTDGSKQEDKVYVAGLAVN